MIVGWRPARRSKLMATFFQYGATMIMVIKLQSYERFNPADIQETYVLRAV